MKLKNSMKIAIVNCKSKKHKTPEGPIPAKELYSHAYAFVPQRKFVEDVYDKHYIISTKYGLISFDEPIEYYDSVLFTQGKGHNKLKTKGEFTRNSKLQWVQDIKTSIYTLLEDINIERIDLHLTTSYWNPIQKEFIDNPRIRWVSQQRNSPIVQRVYREALEMYPSSGLDFCLSHISTIKGEEKETPKTFYHPEDGKIFGKARDVWKVYPYVDLGGLHRVSMNRAKQHRGWVILEEYLDKLNKKEGFKTYRLNR